MLELELALGRRVVMLHAGDEVVILCFEEGWECRCYREDEGKKGRGKSQGI
jgi:hypothetical protein